MPFTMHQSDKCRIAELTQALAASQEQRRLLRETLGRLASMCFGRDDEDDPLPYENWVEASAAVDAALAEKGADDASGN